MVWYFLFCQSQKMFFECDSNLNDLNCNGEGLAQINLNHISSYPKNDDFFLPLSKCFAFHPSSPALPSASAAQRSEVLTLEVKLLGARELHGLAEVEILTDVLHDLQHLLAD